MYDSDTQREFLPDVPPAPPTFTKKHGGFLLSFLVFVLVLLLFAFLTPYALEWFNALLEDTLIIKLAAVFSLGGFAIFRLTYRGLIRNDPHGSFWETFLYIVLMILVMGAR